MPVDLSQVKEVQSYCGSCRDAVNEKLESGEWILLDVRIVEDQFWTIKEGFYEAHLRKISDTIFVLGHIK